jgi:hypothetical protein
LVRCSRNPVFPTVDAGVAARSGQAADACPFGVPGTVEALAIREPIQPFEQVARGVDPPPDPRYVFSPAVTKLRVIVIPGHAFKARNDVAVRMSIFDVIPAIEAYFQELAEAYDARRVDQPMKTPTSRVL